MNKNNFFYFKTSNQLNYLIIFLPIFLITGPFLSDLSISILSLIFFFFLKNKKFFNNYFFITFFIFWILIVISSLVSENKIMALKSSFFYFRFCFFSLCVWLILEREKQILKCIYIALLLCFSLLIFDSIFQYLSGSNIFNKEIIQKDRISSFFGDELIMGSYLMRFSPFLMALSFYFYKKKKHEKFLIPSVIFLFLVQITIFLSGERSSFILFNFSILFFLIFLNDFKKIKFIIFIFYLIILTLLLTIDSPFKKRIVDLTLKQAQINEIGFPNYIFSKQHNEHYLSAWKMFLDNKLIGIGPKNFREICKKDKYNFSELTCSSHPHNIPLQLLSETGIIGFLIYLILNIVIWYNLIKSLFSKLFFKKKYLNNFQLSLLINIAILIWPIMPNGNFFNNWLSITIYYPIGFLLWDMRNNKKMFLNLPKKKRFFSKFNFTN